MGVFILRLRRSFLGFTFGFPRRKPEIGVSGENDDVCQVGEISEHRALLGSQLLVLHQGRRHRPPLRRGARNGSAFVGGSDGSHCSFDDVAERERESSVGGERG